MYKVTKTIQIKTHLKLNKFNRYTVSDEVSHKLPAFIST